MEPVKQRPRPNPVQIGIDIGQMHDPSAVCVAETKRVQRPNGRYWTIYQVHYIQRLQLGTAYPDVAERIVEILSHERVQGRQRRCYIDCTGVGRPVVDLVQRACRDRPEARGVFIRPVTFSGGEGVYNRDTGRLPKSFLVSRLNALLQEQRILGVDTPEMRACTEELRVFERTMTENGSDSYGAKIGKHDDLAVALGLAVLEEQASAQDEIADIAERLAIRESGRAKDGLHEKWRNRFYGPGAIVLCQD